MPSRRRTTGGRARRTTDRPLVVWATVGVLVHVALVGILWATGHGSTWFLHLGRTAKATVLAHRVLGPHVQLPQVDGHDGQEFWVLGRDPFLLSAKSAKLFLDRPSYRADRLGYALLAAPWRLLGERALLWGMIVTNLVVVWAGTWAAARVARNLGAPRRASLAFALCPGVLAATSLDVGDGLALALLLFAIVAVQERRWAWCVAAAVGAVLTKEVSLLAIVAVALLAPGLPKRHRKLLVVVPSVVMGCWAVYVRSRLGWGSGGTGTDVTWPLSGYLRIMTGSGPAVTGLSSQVVAIGVLLIAAFLVVRWSHRRTLLLTAALPFALLTPLLGPFVLGLADNSMRAVAPLVTFLVIDLYSAERHGVAEPCPGPSEIAAAAR